MTVYVLHRYDEGSLDEFLGVFASRREAEDRRDQYIRHEIGESDPGRAKNLREEFEVEACDTTRPQRDPVATPRPRVLVIVGGGCVQDVIADTADIDITVIDHDNIGEGDRVPEPGGFPHSVAPGEIDNYYRDPAGYCETHG